MSFVQDLRTRESVISVELRPPRAELEAAAGIDAWIDLYHSIRTLSRQDIRVMLTDSAVGAQEENNLRHLVTNHHEKPGKITGIYSRPAVFVSAKSGTMTCWQKLSAPASSP